jgi:predicted nucleic acid-binding protein
VSRLFLDANVLFTAAHNPHGKAAFLIALAAEGYWEVVTSTLAVEEAQRNLARKYPSGDIKDFGPYMNQPGVCAGVMIQTVAQFLDSL